MWQATERPWLVSGFFSLFFLTFAVYGLDFSESARIMPLVIAIPATVFSLGQLFVDIKAVRGIGEISRGVDGAAALRMLSWLTLLILLVGAGGLTVGCGLFITLYLRIGAGYRWFFCIFSSLLFMAMQFVVFTFLLGISLYQGPAMILSWFG